MYMYVSVSEIMTQTFYLFKVCACVCVYVCVHVCTQNDNTLVPNYTMFLGGAIPIMIVVSSRKQTAMLHHASVSELALLWPALVHKAKVSPWQSRSARRRWPMHASTLRRHA